MYNFTIAGNECDTLTKQALSKWGKFEKAKPMFNILLVI